MMKYAIALLALVLVGCGGSSSAPTAEEAAPFKAAFEKYTRKRSYGVELGRFETLTVEGDEATAQIWVTAKEVTNLKTRWRVHFTRSDDRWVVTSHEPD
jgi:hypothetical protein